MKDLLLSPLTDTEVYDRANQSDHNLAAAARNGWHQSLDHWHDFWLGRLKENRSLAIAREQRLYRHQLGLSGLAATR